MIIVIKVSFDARLLDRCRTRKIAFFQLSDKDPMGLYPAGSPSCLLSRDRGICNEAARFPRRDQGGVRVWITRLELGDD